MANWLSTIALIVPYTYPTILPKLQGSAVGAGKQCSGPDSACGMQWFNATYDGTSAIEQEMSAMSIFANTLVAFSASGSTSGSSSSYTAPDTPAPVTANTGGNSTSNGDRAGAAILTLVFASAWIGMMVWLVLGGAN